MLVCYRDEVFWIQLWYLCSRRLIGGHSSRLPGPGFVGQGSTSFLGSGPARYRLKSTRMRRLVSTPDAHLWRLTCVWVRSRRPWWAILSGIGSAHDGS